MAEALRYNTNKGIFGSIKKIALSTIIGSPLAITEDEARVMARFGRLQRVHTVTS